MLLIGYVTGKGRPDPHRRAAPFEGSRNSAYAGAGTGCVVHVPKIKGLPSHRGPLSGLIVIGVEPAAPAERLCPAVSGSSLIWIGRKIPKKPVLGNNY